MATTFNYCPGCGKEVESAHFDYCPNCGTRLAPTVIRENPWRRYPWYSNKTWENSHAYWC